MKYTTLAFVLLFSVGGLIVFIARGGPIKTWEQVQISEAIEELEKVDKNDYENYCLALNLVASITSDYDREKFDKYYAEYERIECDKNLGFK